MLGRAASARARGVYRLRLMPPRAPPPVPIAVAGGGGGGRVLVVLPAITWQGLNPVDDDADGFPDTLDNGGVRPARRGRWPPGAPAASPPR